MSSEPTPTIPPGWVGGFAQSNPAFAYPDPDLTSLDMLDNMANIHKLQRQWAVPFPEFSWETRPGHTDPKRCYQMFAPDISRLGYTDEGRVYSIICPQQGATSPMLGTLNVEVTVTGQRGWADEDTRTLAADMTVGPKIWFSPSAQDKSAFKLLKFAADAAGLKLPLDKANAMRVTTSLPGNPKQRIFPLQKGQTKDFPIPDFALHPEAWTVGNLEVEIGPIEMTGETIVDGFNQLVMDVFNLASGNMLAAGNTLAWNVWFHAPELVNQKEWAEHAEKWRHSIDVDHGTPDGPGSEARYFDGTPFEPVESAIEEELETIYKFLKDHLFF